ncbi:MAG: ABC transporter substrate-binding protein [Clostridiales bacterium]|nr:ABC transporter substrate-binding protein [Clostridiales bacterium]
MKKIIAFLSVFTLTLFSSVGCKGNKDDNLIRVNEVTDSFFYAPFYVAIEKGFFEEEGLKIELTNGGGSDVSMTALLSKNADIILAGPETAVYVNRQKREDSPKIFAQLTKRDGCFLVSKNEEPNFDWNNLKNKEIIIGRKGGLPAMTFQYIVKKLGLTEGVDITLRTDIQFNLMAPTFETSSSDYVTLFEPVATEFVSQGKGHIVASVGTKSGEIPYTSFIALESFIKNQSEKVEKFTRAMQKALIYTETAPSEEVASYLIKHFKGSELQATKKSLENYKSVDTWMKNMALPQEMFETLIDVIVSAGESADGVTYSDVVDNSIANKIYSEFR